MPEEASFVSSTTTGTSSEKNLHWCLVGISGALELGLLLLIEISRNFVACLSGPSLLLWLAKEKQALLQGYLQWELPGSGQTTCWETL